MGSPSQTAAELLSVAAFDQGLHAQAFPLLARQGLTARDLAMLDEGGRLKGTVCADEHAVPTSLALRHAGRLQPNRRFIAFPPGQSSPRTLTAADLPAIRASGAWFIRKVDAAVDPFFHALP